MNANDLISRADAIERVEHITSSMSVCVNTDECHGMKRMQRQAVIELANMPSAQRDTDGWCHDCKEYDQDRHCCPRWNRVIRETIKDAQPEPKKGWFVKMSDSDGIYYCCSECGAQLTGHVAMEIWKDGTLVVSVPEGTEVNRVLVREEGAHFGDMYYADGDAVVTC